MAPTRLINRNINAARGRTSMRLEPELWEAIEDICDREQISMRDLVRRAEQTMEVSGRTSAVRVYIVNYYRAAISLGPRNRPSLHHVLAMTGD